MTENLKNFSGFWQGLQQLVESQKLVIDRPKGLNHPVHTEIRYPFDYGYLEGTLSPDGAGIDVWVGSGNPINISGILVTLDLDKLDSEMKIILGCSKEELQLILDFSNSGSMQAIWIPKTE